MLLSLDLLRKYEKRSEIQERLFKGGGKIFLLKDAMQNFDFNTLSALEKGVILK